MTFRKTFRMTFRITLKMIFRMTPRMTFQTWNFPHVFKEDFEGHFEVVFIMVLGELFENGISSRL